MQSPVVSLQSPEEKRSYRQLKVWQKALSLSLETYRVTTDFPKEEQYGLTSQMRRAAVSVPSNIAEGSERGSDKDFVRFLRVASGSLAELETQLHVAHALNYMTAELFSAQIKDCSEVGKMLRGLIQKLETSY